VIYQNVPPNTEVIGDTAKTVEVRLRGPSTLIREIVAKDVLPVIDLAEMPLDSEKTVPLNAQHVHTPFGVEVLQVTPSHVRVSLEPTARVQVRLIPVITGRVAAGFEVESTV